MALGLCDSNQPFLWVIRQGSDPLPEEVNKIVSEKGYIVKWAPQMEVLAHPAVGGFWSHCGCNSTLESLVEGVPMICRPFHGEQKLNAIYIESIWKIGIQIEGEVERGVVERAVKRLLVDEESASMRERALVLKEKVKASVRSGGSSYSALDEFVKYLEKVLEMEEKPTRRRVVLVPVPAQGHITPMMQLAKALHSKGFSITVAQTKFNYFIPSDDFSDFQFVTIPESLPESDFDDLRPILFLLKLNKECQMSFKDCLGHLLVQQGNEISCVIYDEFMYFAGDAAKEFKLPNVIFSTTNATTFVCRSVFEKLYANNVLAPLKDSKGQQDELVPEFHPLRYKDFPVSCWATLESILELYRNTVDERAASAVIINTASCLESSSLSWLQQERLVIPVYPIGPLHIVASAPTSLLEENKSCIEWLNKQKVNSVIYISLGSLALMEVNEVMQTASGLDSSNQHFLWVIRPGSICDSEWIECLHEEFLKMVSRRGYIVKWAPQKEVLAHPAVGAFWSHCGWNSTLESLGEGVPMICRPFSTDQKVNARYLECVWKVGIQVEGELNIGGVEKAVKRLMVDEEGEEMRERAFSLKEKLIASVTSGGSSHKSLEEFVHFLRTLKRIRK
ncbi:unnamed protein product [Microthlaspi erraticum]|uniref:UDP-glycosyltransferases domain-containing protein n=1 Tax=Microthlaspi erraticum TaxID=1685480 RepID=A0A6D2J9Q0_9BRAS|nr:unnamed protein product [Microthlaspi erraticum]